KASPRPPAIRRRIFTAARSARSNLQGTPAASSDARLSTKRNHDVKENRAKKIVREGGMALGTYVGGIADPQIVELIGHAGFDAAFIDLEHTSFDLRDVQLMVMAAERMGIAPIVRTPGFDPAFILRLLDMGVQ